MDLFLVRHAIAEQRDAARWPDDGERPLTAKGEASFRAAARGLATVSPRVDRVLASRYVRAWRTAEILHEEAGWPAPRPCEALEPDRSPEDALAVLRPTDAAASLAFVGHEPLLSLLASRLLTGGGGRARLELKKGSAVLIELAGGPDQPAVLRWSLSPKVLRALDPERS